MASAPGLGWRVAGVAFLAYAGLALQLLGPPLSGPIVSDDALLFVGQRHMEGLSAENVATILDPAGEPVRVTANYAPVHLSGAAPALLGWCAVTGQLEWQAFALFLIIFVWTPPHFWALAIARAR